MTNTGLSKSYLIKAAKRLKALNLLLEEDDYSDVVRESQEAVGLAEKAILRYVGMDPPKWHDVSDIIIENRDIFPKEVQEEFDKLVPVSKWLRKERELSFYGDVDFIPTEEYTREDALRAIEGAKKWVDLAQVIVKV